jgi:hypothetical protein
MQATLNYNSNWMNVCGVLMTRALFRMALIKSMRAFVSQLNFNDQALEQFEKFSHIIEIIENNESAKQQGREKFKQYRRLGVEARTFKL